MSATLKFSGPIKVGELASAPSNPEVGFIYFDTTSGTFQMYENGGFHEISAEALSDHLDGTASQHDASEIDYEEADGNKLNIQAASDDVEAAITDLDQAIGTLNQGSNYTAGDATAVGSHLDAIDDALATAGGTTFADDEFRVQGSADATKQLAFEVDGLTTATTRTVTMPDTNVNLGDIATNTSHSSGDGSDHQDVADLVTLSGSSANSTNHGAFTGATLSDTETTRSALQALETAHEATDTLIDDHLDGTANQHDATEIDYERSDGSKQDIQASSDDVETALTDLDDNKVSITGGIAFTGDQSMGNNKITSLATPTADADAATKAYVDGVASGLDVKDSVRVATTTAGTLASSFENGDTVDGVTLATNDRILIKDQATGSENGIYTVNASGAPTRSTDADSDSEVTAGMFTFVEEGTANADTGWVLTTNDPITVDTTALTFAQFTGAGSITAGDGLDKTGNTLSVNVDGSTIEINADTLRVPTNGISDTQVNSGIDAAKLADGSVSNTEFQYINTLSSNAQTQLDAKLENVVEDTTPQLGGNLDTNANAILHDGDGVKRGNSSTPTNLVEEEYIDSITLAASQTGTAISDLTFAHASFEGLEVTYKLKEATSNDVRIGTFRVVTNGTSVVLSDVSTESADTGITFSAAINGANVEVRYDSGSNAVTMRCDAKRIRA